MFGVCENVYFVYVWTDLVDFLKCVFGVCENVYFFNVWTDLVDFFLSILLHMKRGLQCVFTWQFDCTEVILCGWQAVSMQLLTVLHSQFLYS